MVLLAQLVTEYVADLTDLVSGATRAQEIIDSFGGLTSGPSALADSFDNAGESALSWFDDVAKTAEELGNLASSVETTTEPLVALDSELSETATTLARVTGETERLRSKLATDAVAAADAFSAKITAAGQRVTDFAASQLSKAGSALSSFGQKIADTAQPVIDFGQKVGTAVSNTASTVQSKLQDAGSAVANFGSRVIATTQDAVSSFASNVSDRVSSSLNSFSSKVQQAAEPVVQFGQKVGSVLSGVASKFGQAGLVILGFGIKAQEGVGQAASVIQSKFGQAGQAVTNFGENIRSKFTSAIDSIKEKFSVVSTGLSSFGAKIKEAISWFGQFGEKIQSVLAPANAFISKVREIAVSVQEAGEKARTTASNFLDFTSKIGMTIFGVQSLISGAQNLAQSLLGPAASAEQVKNSLEIFDGSAQSATQEMSNLNAEAAKSPFKTSDVDQFALKLQSVGISAQDTLGDFQALGDGLDAVGRTSGADLGQIADNFVKIKTQGHLTTEVMQSFADMGIDAWGILENQTGKTQAQLQDMISSGLYPASDAMNDLTQGMENNPLYKGQMANDASVFNGAVSTLESDWEQLMTSFGDPVIKALEPEITGISEAMTSPAFQQFAAMIGDRVGGAIKNTADFIHDRLLPPLQNFGNFLHDKVIPWTQSAATNFDKFTGAGNGLKPVLIGLGAVVAAVLIPAFAGLAVEVIAATWPFLLLFGAVAGLVAIFEHFYNNNQDFHNFIDNITTAFGNLWNTLQANFIPTMQKAGNIIQKDVWPFLQKIGTFLIQQFNPAWQKLSDIWNKQLLPDLEKIHRHFKDLEPLLEFLGGFLLGLLIGALAVAVGLIGGFASGLATFLDGIATSMDGINQAAAGLKQFALGVVGFIYDLFTGNLGHLGEDLRQIWDGICNMFQGQWKNIQGFFESTIGTIISLVWGFVSTLITFFTDLQDTLVGHSIVPDMVDKIINQFWRLTGAPVSAVQSMASQAIGILNNLASNAYNAGANIVQQIAGGIRNNIGPALGSAMNAAAQFISAHLPHSPAKLGPLRDLAQQGSEIVNQISAGMLANAGVLDSTLARVTKPVVARISSVSATPASRQPQSSSGSSGGQDKPIIIVLDGRQVGKGLMPHIGPELAKELKAVLK